MKITAYSCREDEREFFEKFSEKYQVGLTLVKDAPVSETVRLAEGSPCISIITTAMDEKLLSEFHAAGVRFISTRTIGYDHIDIDAAKGLGIGVDNVTYSPGSVAEYTVMLMLMAIRKTKAILERSAAQDYSLREVRGRELRNLTVGVMGTGRIGRAVIKILAGFGCRILAYDLSENRETKNLAEYAPMGRLFAESDIITLHMPATDDNFHMIDKDAIALMKDGAYVINTARGALIDSWALIDAIESGKLSGAALDVIENEAALYYNDLKFQVIENRELAILKSFPNVTITPHTAFYTDQAVSDMVENSILSCIRFMKNM